MKKNVITMMLSGLIITAPAMAKDDISHIAFDFDNANAITLESVTSNSNEMQVIDNDDDQITEESIADIQNIVFDFDNSNSIELAMLTNNEMQTTEGEFLPLAILASAGASAWAYHGVEYWKTGHIGSVEGAAFAAATGVLGGFHGGIVARAVGLKGGYAAFMFGHGMGVSQAMGYGNPWKSR